MVSNKETLNLATKKVNKDRIVKLASELIKISSFTGDERNIADRAADLLEESGILMRRVEATERPIILGDLNRDSKPLIVFNGQLGHGSHG